MLQNDDTTAEWSIQWTDLSRQYRQWLEHRLGNSSRLMHSLGVCETAIELATGFGFSEIDVKKALIAGLLHDAAKLMTPADLIFSSEQYGLVLGADDLASPQTLHPHVGATLVQKELGINDETILNAIRYHTTGRAGMSALEKVVFVADKIEARTRNPEYILQMRQELDFHDSGSLNKILLKILDNTLSHLLQSGFCIHPQTLAARNDILMVTKHPHHLKT